MARSDGFPTHKVRIFQHRPDRPMSSINFGVEIDGVLFPCRRVELAPLDCAESAAYAEVTVTFAANVEVEGEMVVKKVES